MLGQKQRMLAFIAPWQPFAADDEALRRQVDVVRNWWTSLTDDQYEILAERWDAEECVVDALNNLGSQLAKARPSAVVGLYVTGHGVIGAADGLFQFRADDGEYDIVSLVKRIFTSAADHVVIVVDACHAYRVSQPIRDAYANAVRLHDEVPAAVVLIAGSADVPNEKPRYGEFAGILSEALERLRHKKDAAPASDRFLTPNKLISVMHDVRRERGQRDLIMPDKVLPTDGGVPSCALPNPAYNPETAVTGSATRDLAPNAATINEYWVSKAAGAPVGDLGWYFTGRRPVMEQVVAWLNGNQPLLVVTGARGSGKSAILGRVIVLADRGFRKLHHERVAEIPDELLPAIGSVDVAIDARGRDAARVCDLILDALDQQVPVDRSSVRQRLAHGLRAAADKIGRPVCVAVDAIDESVNPGALVLEVIQALTRTDRVDQTPAARAIVGVRHDGDNPDLLDQIRLSNETLVEVRTDEDSPDEIRTYCLELLDRPGSPYRSEAGSDAEQAAREIADLMADLHPPNFLDTRVIAEALSAAEQIAEIAVLRDRGVGSILPDQLAAALSAQADRTGRPAGDYLAVLRALAFARGAGVPWGRVWPAMASAVADHDIDDEVIGETLGGPLVVFIMTGSENHERVFRLSHGAITDLLLTSPETVIGVRR